MIFSVNLRRRCPGCRSLLPHRFSPGQRGRQGQGFGKFIHQSFCAGISVRLEDAPGCLVRTVGSSFQGCLDFRRMMGVVIDNRYISYGSFVLETAVGSCKSGKSVMYCLCRKFQFAGYGDGCQCVGDIVDSRYFQGITANVFAVTDAVERWVCESVKDNIFCCIVGFFGIFQCVGQYFYSSVRR